MLKFVYTCGRHEARFPADWALGMKPGVCAPQTRHFAVIRPAENGGFELFVHDKGREKRPVLIADLDTAKRAASLVAELSSWQFSRLRTLVGLDMPRFGIDPRVAMATAQQMRSGAIAYYAIRNNIDAKACQHAIRPAHKTIAPRPGAQRRRFGAVLTAA